MSYFSIWKEDSKVQIILINQPGNVNVLRAGKWRHLHLQNAINFKNYFHLKLMSQSQKCKKIHNVFFSGELNVDFLDKVLRSSSEVRYATKIKQVKIENFKGLTLSHFSATWVPGHFI